MHLHHRASGLTGIIYDAVAREMGVRIVSVNKPGYGRSDFQHGRRLVDWPRDVAALADHLELSRFAATGEGMKPMNRRLFWLAQRAPWLLRLAMGSMLRTLRNPQRRERWIQQQLEAAPEVDRALMDRHPELMQLTLDAALDAFRQGPRGAAQEMQIFGEPWGFALSDIEVPVHVWHGTEDVNVPIAVARRLCQEIPGANASARLIEGGGHALGVDTVRR